MKKIFYLICTLLLAFVVSSYTSPSIDKKVPVRDSINVSINVHQSKSLQKQNDVLYENWLKELNSRTNLDNAKAKLMEKISDEWKQDSYTTLDKLCNQYEYGTVEVLKMARKEVNIKFWESLLSLIISLAIVFYFIYKSIRDKLDWKLVLIFSIIIALTLFIINIRLEYIYSYIFNHDYLTIKELIKFF